MQFQRVISNLPIFTKHHTYHTRSAEYTIQSSIQQLRNPHKGNTASRLEYTWVSLHEHYAIKYIYYTSVKIIS